MPMMPNDSLPQEIHQDRPKAHNEPAQQIQILEARQEISVDPLGELEEAEAEVSQLK